MFENSQIGLSASDEMRCRYWADECVVYHQATGSTHLIDGLGAEVFRFLMAKTTTRHALLQQMQSVFELSDAADLDTLLDKLLLDYQRLGLLQITEIVAA
jgi:PqqD family protein of HPr-rel-A system